jgi:hypothetical protein
LRKLRHRRQAHGFHRLMQQGILLLELGRAGPMAQPLAMDPINLSNAAQPAKRPRRQVRLAFVHLHEVAPHVGPAEGQHHRAGLDLRHGWKQHRLDVAKSVVHGACRQTKIPRHLAPMDGLDEALPRPYVQHPKKNSKALHKSPVRQAGGTQDYPRYLLPMGSIRAVAAKRCFHARIELRPSKSAPDREPKFLPPGTSCSARASKRETSEGPTGWNNRRIAMLEIDKTRHIVPAVMALLMIVIAIWCVRLVGSEVHDQRNTASPHAERGTNPPEGQGNSAGAENRPRTVRRGCHRIVVAKVTSAISKGHMRSQDTGKTIEAGEYKLQIRVPLVASKQGGGNRNLDSGAVG